jgi:MoaA/NifB/PqqE/SkfB family radical SAM enzyme
MPDRRDGLGRTGNGGPGGADGRRPLSNGRRYAGALVAMLNSRFRTHRPFFLAHAVTFGCNSKCQTCSYWKLTPRMKEDLSTLEVFELLDDAYEAGMRAYYLFGGEPLVRKDIGAIVTYAKRKGFLTTMNTNGSLLAAKAPKLTDLDFAFVSLDYHTPYHDTIRGRHGSFEEVIHGIERMREHTDTKFTLVTTISTLNLDAMEPMARLAEELGVMISFNSVEPTLDFGLTDSDHSPNVRLGLTRAELQAFYETLLRLKQAGYPLIETESVLSDFVQGRSWKCEFPKMFVYVAPDKKIYSCDYRYGYDLRTGSFENYFASPAFREHVVVAESCNRCVRTCVRGYSYAYDLHPHNLLRLAADAVILFRPHPGPPHPRNVSAPDTAAASA